MAELLGRIASLRLERPEGDPTRVYGGMRAIDYSQFRPRGHYTQLELLKRYFRTLMWLGRADTGFVLQEPDPGSGLVIDVARERRDAAVLASLLASSKVAGRLVSMSRILDFMVGGIDNLGPEELAKALTEAHLEDLGALADDDKVAGAFATVAASSAQQIRSQVVASDPHSPVKVHAPELFQLFGQRFLIDSFALSQDAVRQLDEFGSERVRLSGRLASSVP